MKILFKSLVQVSVSDTIGGYRYVVETKGGALIFKISNDINESLGKNHRDGTVDHDNALILCQNCVFFIFGEIMRINKLILI